MSTVEEKPIKTFLWEWCIACREVTAHIRVGGKIVCDECRCKACESLKP